MGCASSAAMRMVGKAPGDEQSANGVGVRNLVRSTEGINNIVISDKFEGSKLAHDEPLEVPQKHDGIMQQVHGVGDTIIKKVSMVVQDIEENVENAFSNVKHGAEEIGESISGSVKNAADKVQETLGTAHHEAENAMTKVESQVTAADDAVQGKVDAFQEIANEEVEKVVEIADEKAEEISSAKKKMESAGGDSIDDLIASLTEGSKEEKEVKELNI